MLVIRLDDGESVPLEWVGLDSPDDYGYSWVSDYRALLGRAAAKAKVKLCE